MEHTMIIDDSTWCPALGKALYKDQPYSDVTIVSSDDNKFPCHRCILAAASPVLADMIAKRIARTTVLPIHFQATTMEYVLEFIYKGVVQLRYSSTDTLLQDLQKAAVFLELTWLEKCCVSHKVATSYDACVLSATSQCDIVNNLAGAIDVQPQSNDMSRTLNTSINSPECSDQEENALPDSLNQPLDNIPISHMKGEKYHDILPSKNPQMEDSKTVDLPSSEEHNYVKTRGSVVTVRLHNRKRKHRSTSSKTNPKKGSSNMKAKDIDDVTTTNHMDSVDKKELHTYACDVCDEIFTSRMKLSRHRVTVHKDHLYKCDGCGESYKLKAVFQKHIENRNKNGMKCYCCHHCSATFITKLDWNKHQVQCKGSRQPVYPCVFCKQTFKVEEYQQKHMEAKHTGEEPISMSCKTCQEIIMGENAFNIHLLRRHSCPKPVKRFSCGTCGKAFAYKNDQQNHEKRVHLGVRAFKCDLCPKTFIESSSLKVHRRSHTGERPYVCSICAKRFAAFAYLKKHESFHADVSEYLKCKLCDQTCKNRLTLIVHERTHTLPHLCTECGKRFAGACGLKCHQLQHTGERPYPCKICNKSFTCLRYLKRHVHTHSSVKSFICGDCGKGFHFITALKQHQRIHQGIKDYQCRFCAKAFYDSVNRRRHEERMHKEEMILAQRSAQFAEDTNIPFLNWNTHVE